jgi:nicotinamide mononucleotide transporter
MDFFGQQLSAAELTGTLTGLVAIWLTVRENIWCFPTGIVSCGIYAWLFFSPGVRLYADALLQLVYVALLLYGWINWSRPNRDTGRVAVTTFSVPQRLALLPVILLAAAPTGFLFAHYTDASLPYMDGLTTAMSLVAQWMVARKKIDNWAVWIAANILYLYMYLHKGLFLTAVYYFILLLLAIDGWIRWRRHLTTPLPQHEQPVRS